MLNLDAVEEKESVLNLGLESRRPHQTSGPGYFPFKGWRFRFEACGCLLQWSQKVWLRHDVSPLCNWEQSDKYERKGEIGSVLHIT